MIDFCVLMILKLYLNENIFFEINISFYDPSDKKLYDLMN